MRLVQPSMDFQSLRGSSGADQVDDDLEGLQGDSLPVARDVTEKPMLDLVPLAGARRQVAHGDPQPGLGGQRGELGFPQPKPRLEPPLSAVISKSFASG